MKSAVKYRDILLMSILIVLISHLTTGVFLDTTSTGSTKFLLNAWNINNSNLNTIRVWSGGVRNYELDISPSGYKLIVEDYDSDMVNIRQFTIDLPRSILPEIHVLDDGSTALYFDSVGQDAPLTDTNFYVYSNGNLVYSENLLGALYEMTGSDRGFALVVGAEVGIVDQFPDQFLMLSQVNSQQSRINMFRWRGNGFVPDSVLEIPSTESIEEIAYIDDRLYINSADGTFSQQLLSATVPYDEFDVTRYSPDLGESYTLLPLPDQVNVAIQRLGGKIEIIGQDSELLYTTDEPLSFAPATGQVGRPVLLDVTMARMISTENGWFIPLEKTGQSAYDEFAIGLFISENSVSPVVIDSFADNMIPLVESSTMEYLGMVSEMLFYIYSSNNASKVVRVASTGSSASLITPLNFSYALDVLVIGVNIYFLSRMKRTKSVQELYPKSPRDR